LNDSHSLAERGALSAPPLPHAKTFPLGYSAKYKVMRALPLATIVTSPRLVETIFPSLEVLPVPT